MRYGMIGGFIKFAFAKTAFDYIEKEIPAIDMATYQPRALREFCTKPQREIAKACFCSVA